MFMSLFLKLNVILVKLDFQSRTVGCYRILCTQTALRTAEIDKLDKTLFVTGHGTGAKFPISL